MNTVGKSVTMIEEKVSSKISIAMHVMYLNLSEKPILLCAYASHIVTASIIQVPRGPSRSRYLPFVFSLFILFTSSRRKKALHSSKNSQRSHSTQVLGPIKDSFDSFTLKN